MAYQVTPNMWANAAIVLVSFALIVHAGRRYDQVTDKGVIISFIAFVASLAAFQLNGLHMEALTSVDGTLWAMNVGNGLLIWLVPYTLLWFALEYTGREQWINRWTVGLALVQLGVTFTAVSMVPELFYDVHGMSRRTDVTILGIAFGEYLVLERDLNWLYRLHAAYGVVLAVVAGALLIRDVGRRGSPAWVWHASILAAGLATPVVLVAVVMVGWLPPEQLFTDIGLGVTAVALAVGVFRFRLLDVEGIGRDRTFAALRDPVIILDARDRVVDCNPAAADVFGLSVDRSRVPIDTIDRDLEAAIDAADAPDGTRLEWPTDGDPRRFQATAESIRREDGALGGRVVLFRDVTELRTRAERLQRRETELERQNERLDRFASIVSHDLRTPLTVAAGNAELAEETGSEDAFRRLHEAHDRMDRLIGDLLTLSRTDEAAADAERISVAEHARSVWSRLGIADGELTVRLDRSTTVEAHPELFDTVLQNAFRNAIEHNDPPVAVCVGRLDAEEGFVIADDGGGIPPDERGAVLDHGVTGASGGTGYGLAIVAEVAAAHDWEVRVDESAAGGVRLEFAAPLESPDR